MKLDKKSQLKKTLISLANSYVEICRLQDCYTDDPKAKEIREKALKQTKKFINLINSVNHTDILESIYRTFIGGKETLFAVMIGVCIKKDTVKYWDTTKKGYDEFVAKEKEAQELYEKALNEKKIKQDAIEKAKKEGKKVEFMLKDGKLEPVFTEEKPN